MGDLYNPKFNTVEFNPPHSTLTPGEPYILVPRHLYPTSYTGASSIIFGVILIILILILVVLFINRRPPPIPDPNTIPNITVEGEQSTLGASDNGRVNFANGSFYLDSTACTTGPTRDWIQPGGGQFQCTCISPFYGPQCNLESYDEEYLAIGQVDLDDVELMTISEEGVDRLSFPFEKQIGTVPNPQILCTSLCDSNDDCIGVIYKQASSPTYGLFATDDTEKPQCTLLQDSVLVKTNQNLPFNPLEQSNMYLKNGNVPVFTDRVFVYIGNLVLRYWVRDAIFINPLRRSTAVYKDAQEEVRYRPTMVIDAISIIGIFSNQRIIVDDFVSIILAGTNNQSAIVPTRQTELNLPLYWLNRIIIYYSETPVQT